MDILNDHPRVIPDLGEHAPQDGKPYRPSNGTEGCYFQEGWCQNCKRDQAFQESPDTGEGCSIIANSMAYSPGDPRYPTQWIWQHGEPVCTEFDGIADRITVQERAANLTLPFDEGDSIEKTQSKEAA